MRSAFGIVHVQKSLVNGVFKPASKLSQVERRAVGGYKQARGVSASDKNFQQANAAAHEMHHGMTPDKSLKSKSGTTHIYNHGIFSPLPEGVAGFHIRTGGKRGVSHVHIGERQMFSTTSPKHTLRHEMEHARPARSSYRMSQIVSDPKKTMAEEGRADFSGGHYTKKPKQSGYAQAAVARKLSLKTAKKADKAKGKFKKVPVVGKPMSRVTSAQVRSQNRTAKQGSKHIQGRLTDTMRKPVGNKEVDSYVNVQNKLRRAQKKR